jgi:hypothetical protein
VCRLGTVLLIRERGSIRSNPNNSGIVVSRREKKRPLRRKNEVAEGEAGGTMGH